MANPDHLSSENKTGKGLVMIYTGHGKGKTTAALGLIFRAMGHGLRVCVIQFIKNRYGQWGENKTAQELGIEWHVLGDGFTWQSRNKEQTIARTHDAWQLAQEKIASGLYDLVLLDEFTYPLVYKWIDVGKVVEWLTKNKPSYMHLIITGRDAPGELIDYADLVTEMVNVKHPFERGVKAQRGIEF